MHIKCVSLEEIANKMNKGEYFCNDFKSSMNLELLKKNPLTLSPTDKDSFDRSKRDLSKLVSWITSMNSYELGKSIHRKFK